MVPRAPNHCEVALAPFEASTQLALDRHFRTTRQDGLPAPASLFWRYCSDQVCQTLPVQSFLSLLLYFWCCKSYQRRLPVLASSSRDPVLVVGSSAPAAQSTVPWRQSPRPFPLPPPRGHGRPTHRFILPRRAIADQPHRLSSRSEIRTETWRDVTGPASLLPACCQPVSRTSLLTELRWAVPRCSVLCSAVVCAQAGIASLACACLRLLTLGGPPGPRRQSPGRC